MATKPAKRPETPDDAFLERVGTDLDAFAEALFAESEASSWIRRLQRFDQRADWPAIREGLLRSAEVDACLRTYAPEARCVLETLLQQLGATGTDAAIARLARLADASPQLTLYALHALLAAGPKGVDAAAGPPGAPGPIDDRTAHLRARAALVRGDRLEDVWRGSATWKNGVLRSLVTRYANGPRAEAATLLVDDAWLAVVVDALFVPELADSAEAALQALPPTRWKPLVAARKQARKVPARKSTRPTAAELAALDEELTRTRDQLAAIVARLRREGYAFQAEPLVPPPRAFTTKLKQLERRIGKVPVALARFWAIVGEVDLRGNHPRWAKKTWIAKASDPHWFADPLVVGGLPGALTSAADSDFDVAEATDAQRYALDLAGDDVTKANFSGGIISVATPSDAIDPPLHGRDGTFLAMLREAIAWSGFPGFAKIPDAPIARST